MCLLLGAYAQDKNTTARVCVKNVGGLMREGGGGGGVFAGRYGTRSLVLCGHAILTSSSFVRLASHVETQNQNSQVI